MIQDGETRMEKVFGWFDLCHSSVAIQIDDRCPSWRVHREPQWCTGDGWKGLSIAVRLDDLPWNRIVADEVLVRVTGDDRHCGSLGGTALINQ